MNWQSVAAQLAQLGLPILGRVLGGYIPIIGPILGGVGGEHVGKLVANAIGLALGVPPTPEAISNAIESGETTEVVAKLKAIEGEAAVRWPALATIEQSNDLAQVESAKINAQSAARLADTAARIGANDFWPSLYRSILLYGTTFNLLFFGGVFFYALLLDPALWARMVEGREMITWWVGANASVLGFHFYTRGKEREAAVTMEKPASPIGNVIKAATSSR